MHANPDLGSSLMHHHLGADAGAARCTQCQRRPLPGELVHVYDAGQTLCTLCARAGGRAPLRSERIHVGCRSVAVMPRAA